MLPGVVPTRIRRAASLASALLLLCLDVSGQEPATPTFKSGVSAVLVDVSVTDADRRPVRGLRATDFTVTEDGTPQKIISFSAVDAPKRSSEQRLPSWWQEVPADVSSNTVPPNGRLVVVVLDDLLPMAPGDLPRAKELTSSLLQALGPSDLVGLVFLSGRQMGVNFTVDHARLAAALSKYEPRSSRDFDEEPTPLRGTSPATFRRATTSVRNLVEALGEVRGRRKAIAWISAGMPVVFGDGSNPRDDLAQEWAEIFELAARGNVSVYPMDPGGLRGAALDLNRIGPTAWNFEAEPRPYRQEGDLNVRFLEDVAANTGGFAVVRGNDPSGGLTRVIEETGTYYLIGYQPAQAAKKGRHRIEVKVARPGLVVRGRNEYWSSPAIVSKAAGGNRNTDLVKAALAAIVPIDGIGLAATVASFLGTDRRNGDVAVVIGVSQATAPRLKTMADAVEVVLNAYGEAGKLAGSVTTHAQVGLPVGGETINYELLAPIRLKPGRYELRVGVGTTVDPKAGSLTCELEVPDFARLPLSISGLVLTKTPSGASAPRDALKSFLSVIPTAQRVFQPDERVTVVFRVYQGGSNQVRSVPLRVRILKADGTAVFEQREIVDSGLFARERTVERRVVLPLDQCASGQHLLEVDAGDGKDVVRRQLRVEIR